MNIKVFTAFSGYDSQCMALDLLKEDGDFDYQLIGWSEIEKNAILAHDAVFPEASNLNYGDVAKIDWSNVPDFDLFTYSFPCQSLSKAGKMSGLTEGSGTESSLLWECRKAIATKRPKFLLMENVLALTYARFRPEFDRWIHELESLGYKNFWKVLNAADYGVPQNRERTFMVSILGDAEFIFPQTLPEFSRVQSYFDEQHAPEDFLEDIPVVCDLDASTDDVLIVKQATKQGFVEVQKDWVFDVSYPTSKTRRGRVQIRGGQNLCPTITAHGRNALCVYSGQKKVRRLTGREAFRLMGVRDDDIQKIEQVIQSETLLFKLAGNSIVVDCMYYIFKELFK